MTRTLAYGLWLTIDPTGLIVLLGWTEPVTGSGRTDHWPAYPLCRKREQLAQRLDELGLTLYPGADIADLDMHWDVYLRHDDPPALRARLSGEPPEPPGP